MTGATSKAGWRARLLAARRALGPADLAAAADSLRDHLLSRLAGTALVAAYVPVGREPGSVALLDRLRAMGTEVLLPVVVGNDLAWAPYRGESGLAPGALGLSEPVGPRLRPAVLTEVDAVLVPALAVDRRGIRLGRGAGYYDRTLVSLRPATPTVALLHDGELVNRLPADPWDRPVTAVVTPASGWTELPAVEHHGS